MLDSGLIRRFLELLEHMFQSEGISVQASRNEAGLEKVIVDSQPK
jgi:hypothetical protein